MSALIASILTAVVPSLISWVEKKRGAGTGAEKFQDVYETAVAVLQVLAARGVGSNVINDNDVKAAIETLVQSMKTSGTLQETKPATPSVVAGHTLRVKIEEVLS